MREPTPHLFDLSSPSALPADATAVGERADTVGSSVPALVTLWRYVLRGKWIILLCMLTAAALGWFAIHAMTPIYQSTATLLVESGRTNIVSIEAVYAGLVSDREHLQTQSQFLQSREVGLRVIRDLDLVNHPSFRGAVEKARPIPGVLGEPAERMGSGIPGIDAAVISDPKEEAVFREYLKALTIEPIRQSQLLLVKFASPDPVLAALVANRVAEAYIQAEMDMRLQMTLNANAWLAERVAELRTKLEESEKRLATQRESANLVEQGGVSKGSAGQQVGELSQRIVEARVRRAQAEQLYNQVRRAASSGDTSPLAAVPGVARAREHLAASRLRFASAAERYGPSHPAYQQAQAEVESAQAALDAEVAAAIADVRKDYQVALATESSLQEALEQALKRTQADNRMESQIAALEQEVAANRQIYQTFLVRMKETTAAGNLDTPAARLVDRAVASSRPIKPRKVLLLSAAIMAGGGLGILIALGLGRLDGSLRSVDGTESALGVPVLAALPRLRRKEKRNRGRLVIDDPDSAFSEMVRMAAASVRFAALDGHVRSIVITSAAASEGKSTTALNLALALAKNSRVVLLDADLHRPNTARLLGISIDGPGLVEVMRGDAEIEDAIYTVPGSTLDVVLAHRGGVERYREADPDALRRVIDQLQERYDLVLVDAPPVEVVSDAMSVARSCAYSIVVARAGATHASLVRKALQRLRRIRSNVLGVILCGHDFEGARRYYGEASGYGMYETYAEEGK